MLNKREGGGSRLYRPAPFQPLFALIHAPPLVSTAADKMPMGVSFAEASEPILAEDAVPLRVP